MRTLRILTILLLLLAFAGAKAQTTASPGERQFSVLIGAGSSNQLDTYLSPMEYQGAQVSFRTDRRYMTRRAGRRISFQSTVQGAVSHTDNPSQTASDWGVRLGYDAGWHYNWTPTTGLRLMAGGLLGGRLGILYNDRNGNNPVQVRALMDVAASVAARYEFRIRRFPLALRYQADVPLMGCMFSPQYGQSYYEFSQGNRDHNAVFTHPGNALCLGQLLLLDIPLRRLTLRVGYQGDIQQSHANGIRQHDICHSAMIGFVRHFRPLQRKERKGVDL